ncbi:hypothetical protein [Roseibium suaedae]|uniref:Uncharacterized protein n=1 Tax=Roseibium suaedae TaxID=735517 RepID=A0A1M7L5V7_9HYPH|nr:hypothetical protein [Roseibium suaedae]SHM73285.1 hypothetical protein SAMN05444272_3082 [Roseibium suaedae]
MHKNPIVDFIRTYGPSASSDSIYDEHVVSSSERLGVSPIEVESGRLDDLVLNFQSPNPKNVILTGTAGDGKTWHCRRIFEKLGGDLTIWQSKHGMLETTLPGSGIRLVIVKDLSQFEGNDLQREILQGMIGSLLGRDQATVYLVAANDGQLLRFWRKYSSEGPDVDRIGQHIRTMLETGSERCDDLHLEMHNLSRQRHDVLFSQLVDAVHNHDGWTLCNDCPLLAGEKCAIRRNRAIIGTDGATRQRLTDLIRIAAANDQHLPMRHLLLLIANIVLGVSGKKTPMMTCKTAHELADNDTRQLSNPFDNALGLNLGLKESMGYLCFSILHNAGIGEETNNEIDGLLIEGQPSDLYDQYVKNDELHGANLFENKRSSYRRGEIEDYSEFQQDLETQRRRLFFTLPDTDEDDEIDPWKLTVFKYGGMYVSFWDGLNEGRMDEHIRSRLVIGLNRSYSGMMCEDSATLYLTGPAANAQSRVGRVLDYDMPVGSSKRDLVMFDFEPGDPFNRPKMTVRFRRSHGDSFIELASAPLQPILFEYLLRVREGSLPSSFSRQCFEELRQFRLRILAGLEANDLIDIDHLKDLRIVKLGESGRLQPEELGVTESI